MNTELLISTIKNSSICVHDVETAERDSIWNWHTHEEYEMYMSIDGSKTFCINNKEYTLHKGDIIFINEKIPHKTRTPQGSKGFLIQFKTTNEPNDSYKYLIHFINHSSLDASVFKASTAINAELSDCLTSIMRENTLRAKSFEDFIRAETYKIFAILYRYDIIKNPENFFVTNEINKILPVLHYIDNHYNEKISLEYVSSLLNFDRSHFCRIFRKSVHTTFIDYINFVRISEAEKLLILTEKTISDIAEATGFASTAYFTKIFKHYKTCTPSQYRKIKS